MVILTKHNRVHHIILFLIFTLVSLSGCGTIEPVRSMDTVHERIFDKNYKLLETQSSYVGETIIQVKDYWVKKEFQNKVMAKNGFTLETPFAKRIGSEGDKFLIYGKSKRDGTEIFLIKLNKLDAVHFGITEEGKWANFVITDFGKMKNSDQYKLHPIDTKFEIIKDAEIDLDRGFLNFEILFNGTTKSSINLLYREYTPDNMARPAFYQNLTYPIDTEIIRFKAIRIKVNEISNESISYTVLEDGLSE